MNQLPNRFPTYLVMPPEFDWDSISQTLRETGTPNKGQKVVPGIGQVSESPEVWGNIHAVKTVSRMDSQEVKKEKFCTVIHTGCQVGRCFRLNTAKDFLYPLNKDVLAAIYTRQMSFQQVARFMSWMECTPEEIKLIMFPTVKERQAKYQYWLDKLKDEQEALKKVVMKTTWAFSPKDLGIVND